MQKPVEVIAGDLSPLKSLSTNQFLPEFPSTRFLFNVRLGIFDVLFLETFNLLDEAVDDDDDNRILLECGNLLEQLCGVSYSIKELVEADHVVPWMQCLAPTVVLSTDERRVLTRLCRP